MLQISKLMFEVSDLLRTTLKTQKMNSRLQRVLCRAVLLRVGALDSGTQKGKEPQK